MPSTVHADTGMMRVRCESAQRNGNSVTASGYMSRHTRRRFPSLILRWQMGKRKMVMAMERAADMARTMPICCVERPRPPIFWEVKRKRGKRLSQENMTALLTTC